jgi:hypothetical protein
MTHRIGRFAVAGAVAVLAFVAECQSATKQKDPIGELQSKVLKEISAVVKDSGRAAQVEALFQDFFGIMRQMWGETSEYRAKSDALNADYDTTPQQFNELYAGHMARHKAFLKQLVEMRGRIAGLLTDEEWKKLNDVRADIRTLGIAID